MGKKEITQQWIEEAEDCLDNHNFEEARLLADKIIDLDEHISYVLHGYYIKAQSYDLEGHDIFNGVDDDDEDALGNAVQKQQKYSQRALDICRQGIEYAEGHNYYEWNGMFYMLMAEIVEYTRGWTSIKASRYAIAAMSYEDSYSDAKEKYKSFTDCQWIFGYNEWYKYKNLDCKELGMTNEEYEEGLILFEMDSFHKLNESEAGNSPYIYIVSDINHLKGCYDPTDTIFWTFTKDRVPLELEFPLGHPVANTLYIVHPLNKLRYIPYELAEEILFLEKIREFCQLVQCLGAKKIEITYHKGQYLASSFEKNLNIGANVAVEGHKGNLMYSRNSSCNQSKNNQHGVSKVQTFMPTEKPYCPNDLEWLEHEPEWLQIVRQRQNGDLLHSEIKMSSKGILNESSNQKTAIQGSYSNLICNINANYGSTLNTTLNSSEECEWSISVEFESIKNLSKGQTQMSHELTLTPNEETYRQDVKVALEEGELGNDIRAFLNRKRDRLGISQERAAEIEALCKITQLTNEEKEYLKEYKEMIEDYGAIGSIERKRLERIRERLKISRERAIAIESTCKW